jgi:hypothetical protein
MKTYFSILILVFGGGEVFSQSIQNDSLLQNLENCLIRTLFDNGMHFSRPDTNDVFFVKTMVLNYNFNSSGSEEWTEIPVGYPKPVLLKKDNQSEWRQSICVDHVDGLKQIWEEEDWSLLFIFDHFMLGPKGYPSKIEKERKVSLASDAKVADIVKKVEEVSDLKKTTRMLFTVGPVVY